MILTCVALLNSRVAASRRMERDLYGMPTRANVFGPLCEPVFALRSCDPNMIVVAGRVVAAECSEFKELQHD